MSNISSAVQWSLYWALHSFYILQIAFYFSILYMKIYIKPSIRFNQVRSCDLITTSDPQLIDDTGADPDSPVLAPKRDKDWENW